VRFAEITRGIDGLQSGVATLQTVEFEEGLDDNGPQGASVCAFFETAMDFVLGVFAVMGEDMGELATEETRDTPIVRW